MAPSTAITPLALPAVLPSILYHDWSAEVQIESRYETDASESVFTLAEQRWGLFDRPTRAMSVSFWAKTPALSSKLRMQLARFAHTRAPVPIYPDDTVITASPTHTTSTQWTVPCDTSNRRFFVGARAVFCEAGSLAPNSFAFATVTAIAPTVLSVTFPTAPSVNFDVGAVVFPCMDAEINLTASASFLTDDTPQVDIDFIEVPGASTLPGSASSPPGAWPTFQSLPIISWPIQWGDKVTMAVRRAGKRFDLGRGTLVFAQGTRPQIGYGLPATATSRAEFWEVLNFFDWARGRQRASFVISPDSMFDVTAQTTTYVEVTKSASLSDLQTFLSFVGIEFTDGTRTVRDISSITDQTTVWRITFGSTIPATTIRRFTSAIKSRLESDVLREEWSTDGVVKMMLPFQELLAEQTVSIANLGLSSSVDPTIEIDDLFAWFDMNANTFTGTSTGAATGPALALEPDVEGDPITRVCDVRDPLNQSPLVLVGASDGGSYEAPKLYRFNNPWLSGNRKFANHQSPGGTLGELFYLRPTNAQFFDNTTGKGLTIFWFGRIPPASPEGYFFRRRGVIEWSTTKLDLYEDFNIGGTKQTFTYADVGKATVPFVMTLRWDPNTSCKVYRNGVPLGAFSTQIADIPTASSLADELLSAETTRIMHFDKVGSDLAWSNMMVIYRRALTQAQLNSIGPRLFEIHDLPTIWTGITV